MKPLANQSLFVTSFAWVSILKALDSQAARAQARAELVEDSAPLDVREWRRRLREQREREVRAYQRRKKRYAS